MIEDEMYSFTICSHKNITQIRKLFINKLGLIGINKAYNYIKCLHDKSVPHKASRYIRDMIETFNREIMKI